VKTYLFRGKLYVGRSTRMSNPQQVQDRETLEASDIGEAAPPTLRPRDVMLLDFLRQYDAPCPLCGYNLKALTQPICPECGQELTLTVGAARLRFGWLFAAVAPGFFSGIAACFLLVPIVGQLVFGDGKMSPVLNVLDLFGLCSGGLAIFIAIKRHRFLAQPRARQRALALLIWIIHVVALVMFLLFGPMFI
jgi:hypothetical protein